MVKMIFTSCVGLAVFMVTGFMVIGAAPATAQDSARKVIREDIPPIENLYRVSAAKTPSGFPVPRYVSLKVGKVNGRAGPSRQHAVMWQYRRKGLPLIIVAETDMWRKVRDIHGDESWIHKPALSGERRIFVLEDTFLHAKPRESAKITAQADKNALMKLGECNDNGWCQVRSDNGLKGWAPRYKLWGAQQLY